MIGQANWRHTEEVDGSDLIEVPGERDKFWDMWHEEKKRQRQDIPWDEGDKVISKEWERDKQSFGRLRWDSDLKHTSIM